MGNIGIQMVSTGILSDMSQFREIVKTMPDIVRYENKNSDAYEKAFEVFKGVVQC